MVLALRCVGPCLSTTDFPRARCKETRHQVPPQTIFSTRWPARRLRAASTQVPPYRFQIRHCAINSACRWRFGRNDLRRLLLRADQLAVDQALRDLNGVEGRALTQIVRDAPQYQPIVDGGVFADAADIG